LARDTRDRVPFFVVGSGTISLGRATRPGQALVCFDKLYDARRTNSGDDKPRVDLAMEPLLKTNPPEHVVTLLWTDGLPDYSTQAKSMALTDLTQEYGEAKFSASLYVPRLA